MRRALLAFAAAVITAGCGSTAQLQSVAGSDQPIAGTSGEPGLSAPTSGGTQPGTVVPGATGTGSSSGAGGVDTPGAGTGSGGSGGSGATTAPGTSTGQRNTTPLKIGLAYINNQSASSALGASDPRTNSVKAVIQAYVKAINAAGGLAGRKLETVEYEWHSGDGSWSTAASAACAKFTQDAHVSVVLDQAFGTVGGFRDCLRKAGVFDITNQTVGDTASSAGAPFYAGVGGLTLDRTYSAVLTGEMHTGYLHKSDQLGVIIEGCAENLRAYSQTLSPLIKELGLATPKVVTFNCVDSTAGGAAQGQAAISNAILRFRQPPVVNRVMFVSAEESAALLLFGPSASSQGYRPGYLLSSNAQAHLFTDTSSGFPSDQMPQLHGVGNIPFADVSNASPTVVEQRCLALIRPTGLSPANYDDRGQALFSCGPFLLLEALLKRTAGDASAGALANGVAVLGSSFAAPAVLASSTSYSTSQHDGGDLVRPFVFVSGCRCMKYAGRMAHAP
jgi:hypothetical protein